MSALWISPNKSKRVLPVQFICIHWSGGSYASSKDWCLRDESAVSYHRLIGRNEDEIADLVPWHMAAWSVGWAKSIDPQVSFRSDTICLSNHASENIALSGGPPVKPTEWQVDTLIDTIVDRFQVRGWSRYHMWRIWGHDQCAVFPPGHRKAGQFGRKPDPQGQGWLPIIDVKERVYARLA